MIVECVTGHVSAFARGRQQGLVPVEPHQFLEVRVPPAWLLRIGKRPVVLRYGLWKVGQSLADRDGVLVFLPPDQRLRRVGEIPLERQSITKAEHKNPAPVLWNAKI